MKRNLEGRVVSFFGFLIVFSLLNACFNEVKLGGTDGEFWTEISKRWKNHQYEIENKKKKDLITVRGLYLELEVEVVVFLAALNHLVSFSLEVVVLVLFCFLFSFFSVFPSLQEEAVSSIVPSNLKHDPQCVLPFFVFLVLFRG